MNLGHVQKQLRRVLGVDRVVPLGTESMTLDVQGGHIVVGHGQAFLIEGLNPISLNGQAVGGGGAANAIERQIK